MKRWPIMAAATLIMAATAQADVFRVNPDNASPIQDGASWGTGYTTIQAAIDAADALPGQHQVWVAADSYKETVVMADGVSLYGGFAGTETSLSERDWIANETIIDGEDTRQCVLGADDASFDGFVVRRGFVNNSGNGGGMANINSSPTVANCFFLDNRGGFGGAVFNSSSDATFENCVFYGNSAQFGSVMYNILSDVDVTHCTAHDNLTTQFAGGIHAVSGSLLVWNSILWFNGAAEFINDSADIEVFDSVIRVNQGQTINYTGDNHITSDPSFFDPDNGDVRLRPGSPAIDAANSGAGVNADILDRQRPIGDGPDMGSYEFMADDPTDTDGDGIPDVVEDAIDSDHDGTPDYLDTDSDNNGVSDLLEGLEDFDGDGVPNYLDDDNDGNGISDLDEGTGDLDDDGTPDVTDPDNDGDGIPDFVEGILDTDNDGSPNYRDTDSDGDGIPDKVEGTGDADLDGIPNYLDLDSNGSGVSDAEEGMSDTDGDGIPDFLDDDKDIPRITNDLNADGRVNAVDVQIMINAVLGL